MPEFNSEVKLNERYKYTTNALFSSIAANRRMTEAIIAFIPPNAETIVDIGCGDAAYTMYLKKVLDRNYRGGYSDKFTRPRTRPYRK